MDASAFLVIFDLGMTLTFDNNYLCHPGSSGNIRYDLGLLL